MEINAPKPVPFVIEEILIKTIATCYCISIWMAKKAKQQPKGKKQTNKQENKDDNIKCL